MYSKMRENKFTISIKVIIYKLNASFFIIFYFYLFNYFFLKKCHKNDFLDFKGVLKVRFAPPLTYEYPV